MAEWLMRSTVNTFFLIKIRGSNPLDTLNLFQISKVKFFIIRFKLLFFF